MKKPTILLTNDDGYYAEGLEALYKSLSKLADVIVVAPDQNCSGVSHKISLNTPLRLRKITENIFALNGSPADCIHIALHVVLEGKKPDMVISGINHGLNLGEDTAYSGTVAAAYEGQAHQIPSIAVSTNRSSSHLYEFKHACHTSRLFVQKILAGELPDHCMWNLNIPAEKPLGVKFTRLDSRSFQSSIIKRSDPRGEPYYWIGPYHPVYDAEEGTDFHAFKAGYVSATPLKVEMTHYQVLDSISTEEKSAVLSEALLHESN
jgi:5'-nucleotidase